MEEIKILIEKFFDGNTTVEEERYLCRYLRTHDVPEYMQGDKEIILACAADRADVLPEQHFGARIENYIDTLGAAADAASASSASTVLRRRLGMMYKMTGVAAAMFIAVVMGYAMTMMQSHEGTFDNPYDAYMCVNEVLGNLSSAMNGGVQNVQNIGTEFEWLNANIDNKPMMD